MYCNAYSHSSSEEAKLCSWKIKKTDWTKDVEELKCCLLRSFILKQSKELWQISLLKTTVAAFLCFCTLNVLLNVNVVFQKTQIFNIFKLWLLYQQTHLTHKHALLYLGKSGKLHFIRHLKTIINKMYNKTNINADKSLSFLTRYNALILPDPLLVRSTLILRLLILYIYGAPSRARNANVVYIWTYVWQSWNSLCLFAAQCFNTESMQRGFLCQICV